MGLHRLNSSHPFVIQHCLLFKSDFIINLISILSYAPSVVSTTIYFSQPYLAVNSNRLGIHKYLLAI